MTNAIELAYGRNRFKFTWDAEQFALITSAEYSENPLTDFAVGEAFDSPIGSPPLDEIIDSDDSVLLVVSDATRPTGSAQLVNLLVRRLVQLGVSPARMAVIFATGIHRRVSDEEKRELLTPFIVQRLKLIDHDAYDPAKLTSFGATESGVEVELSSALRE